MKKWMQIAGLGVAALLAPAALLAQADTNAAPSSMPGTQPATGTTMRETLGAPGLTGQQMVDKAFVRSAVEEGIAEVKLGQLAVAKGGPEVKTLAQTLVDDHSAINKDMAAIADTLGVLQPKKMNKDDQAEFDKLNKLSGKEFDAEYILFIAKAHGKDMHDFHAEAMVAADSSLAEEVVKAMHTMHGHMEMIAKVAASEGIALPPRPQRPNPDQSAGGK
ncbi:MAG: DUF4142 domain-containing protein [Acidobacteriaceae bacterium]|nr:DUF4142 domain-containing protein [Acidobacteriaceae bacterium]